MYMKKKVAPKQAAKRTSQGSHQPIFFRRIVIISACLILVVAGVITINRHSVSRAVAGVSISRGLFMQSTIQLPTNPDAASYNIYYKRDREKDFTNAARNILPTVSTYTISYLKKGAVYQYRIATVNSKGKEVSFSEVKQITNLQPM